jgi:HlyD family secretion protein
MSSASNSSSSSSSHASVNEEHAPWEAKSNKPKRGRWRRLVSWAFGIGLLMLAGYGLRPQPVEVEVVNVTRGPLTVHVSEEGKTRIRNRYVVSAPVAGQMKRVPFKAGDPITAGETVLATIEPSQAPLLDARSKAQAEARVEMATAALKRAGEAEKIARTNAQFAQANWERVKRIADSGSVSELDRDNAENASLVAQREVQSAEFALQVAQYDLQQAKANLLQFDTTQENAGAVVEVRAPVTGSVLKVMQESTSVVTPGMAIMEVGDPRDIEIEAEILSRDAVAIEPGAIVSIEQWGGEPLRGRVRRVEPAAFTKVSALGVEEQRVIVLVDFVDPPAQVQRLGDRYRVEVRVAVWKKEEVMLIPAGAVFREGNLWRTFIYDNGKAKAVTVEAGRSDGRMTELLSGLEPGAQVLLHPPDTVVDGVSVKRRK